MGFWWTLNLLLLQPLWGAFWMAAFWSCKWPQLSEAAEGRGGMETAKDLGADSFSCRCSQTVYLHTAGCVRWWGVVELVGKWGDCPFVGDSYWLALTHSPCGNVGPILWFFSREARNLIFTWEFPILSSNNKNPCAGQTSLRGPRTASLQPLGGRLRCAFVLGAWKGKVILFQYKSLIGLSLFGFFCF